MDDEEWPDEMQEEEEKLNIISKTPSSQCWDEIDDSNNGYLDILQDSNNLMMDKKKSSKLDNQIRVYTMNQVMNDQMPQRIKKAKDLLCYENDDIIISILRHYNWNQTKIEENWFEN